MQSGKYLQKFWVDSSKIHKTATPIFLLGKISENRIEKRKGITAAESATTLMADLEQGGMISSKNLNAPYRLDLAITEMDPGSASGRVWAGELGVGHAHLQIEGKVVDVDTGRVVAAFAERHGSSGNIGIDDLSGDAGPALVRKMIKQTSEEIGKELQSEFSL